MARQASKTARRSTPTMKKGDFEYSPDCPRLVPTGGGEWAYVRGVAGRTLHVRVGSDAYYDAVDAVLAALGTSISAQRLRADIERLAGQYPGLGWELRAAVADDDTVEGTEAIAA